MEIAMQIAGFIAKAIPVLVQVFEAHDRDEAAALAALDVALEAARAKTDADLAAKHRAP